MQVKSLTSWPQRVHWLHSKMATSWICRNENQRASKYSVTKRTTGVRREFAANSQQLSSIWAFQYSSMKPPFRKWLMLTYLGSRPFDLFFFQNGLWNLIRVRRKLNPEFRKYVRGNNCDNNAQGNHTRKSHASPSPTNQCRLPPNKWVILYPMHNSYIPLRNG